MSPLAREEEKRREEGTEREVEGVERGRGGGGLDAPPPGARQPSCGWAL